MDCFISRICDERGAQFWSPMWEQGWELIMDISQDITHSIRQLERHREEGGRREEGGGTRVGGLEKEKEGERSEGEKRGKSK